MDEPLVAAPVGPGSSASFVGDVDSLSDLLSVQSGKERLLVLRNVLRSQLNGADGEPHLRNGFAALSNPLLASDSPIVMKSEPDLTSVNVVRGIGIEDSLMSRCLQDAMCKYRAQKSERRKTESAPQRAVSAPLKFSYTQTNEGFIYPDFGLMERCPCDDEACQHLDCRMTVEVKAFRSAKTHERIMGRMRVAYALWHAWQDYQIRDASIGPCPCGLQSALTVS